MLLYVDDDAVPFTSRADMILGTKIIERKISRFGLVVHSGTKNKTSKTEFVFFPCTKTTTTAI